MSTPERDEFLPFARPSISLGPRYQSGDVVDNLTGLVIGLVAAAGYVRLRRWRSRA